jgi:hypothetical protein
MNLGQYDAAPGRQIDAATASIRMPVLPQIKKLIIFSEQRFQDKT